jgi:hypothetical protein
VIASAWGALASRLMGLMVTITRGLTLSVACSALWGCYFPEPLPLTAEQRARVAAHLLTPTPAERVTLGARQVGAEIGGVLRVVGVDIDRAEARPGEEVAVTYFLEAMGDIPADARLMVHLQAPRQGAFQNLDHEPVGGLLPLSALRRGQVVKDTQRFRVSHRFPPSEATLFLGVFRGAERLVPTLGALPEGVKRAEGVVIDAQRRVAVAPLKVGAGRYRPKAKAAALGALPRPVIDGRLDEAVWGVAVWTRWWGAPSGDPRASTPPTRAKFAWAPDALYVAVECRDSDVWSTFTARDSNTWEQEVVEVFLDPDGDHLDYLELQVTPANVVFDARFESYRKDLPKARAWDMRGLETEVAVDGTLNARDDQDRGWIVELRIPAAEVPGARLPLSANAQWRLNLFRFDSPQGEPQRAAALSPPVVPDFHALEAFADLTLLPEPSPPAQP